MSNPYVSVVIPAYNAAATLTQAVQSVLRQTFDKVEVLIVDDGSTDQTRSSAQAIRDPRVRVITQENAGAANARNTGIAHSSGTYVAFLDADDVWLPNKLERQLEVMEVNTADASQTGVWFVNGALLPLYRGRCPEYEDALMEILLFRHLPGFSSTLLVKRDLLDTIGGFDETLVILEDWDLAVRLARHGSLQNLDEPLTMYRLHPANRSRDGDLHVEPGVKVLERLFNDTQLPDAIRKKQARIYAAMYTMFSGGALRSGHIAESVRWAVRATRNHPAAVGDIIRLPFRRFRRRLEQRRWRDLDPSRLLCD